MNDIKIDSDIRLEDLMAAENNWKFTRYNTLGKVIRVTSVGSTKKNTSFVEIITDSGYKILLECDK